MNQVEIAIQSLRINPIHSKWELMFVDKAGHFLPVFLNESQANLVRQEMREPGSVGLSNIEITGIDFRIDELGSVTVGDLKEGILKTKLIIHHNNKHLQIKYPPEKAIVLALREGVPILME